MRNCNLEEGEDSNDENQWEDAEDDDEEIKE